MSWGYRVFFGNFDDEDMSELSGEYFIVHEVYQDEDGKVVSITDTPIIVSQDLAGIQHVADSIVEALGQEVLSYEELAEEAEQGQGWSDGPQVPPKSVH